MGRDGPRSLLLSVVLSLRVRVPLATGSLALSPGLDRGAWGFEGPPVSKMIAFQPGATVCARAFHKRVLGLLVTCGRLYILVDSGSRAARLPTRRCDCDGYFSVLVMHSRHPARIQQGFQ